MKNINIKARDKLLHQVVTLADLQELNDLARDAMSKRPPGPPAVGIKRDSFEGFAGGWAADLIEHLKARRWEVSPQGDLVTPAEPNPDGSDNWRRVDPKTEVTETLAFLALCEFFYAKKAIADGQAEQAAYHAFKFGLMGGGDKMLLSRAQYSRAGRKVRAEKQQQEREIIVGEAKRIFYTYEGERPTAGQLHKDLKKNFDDMRKAHERDPSAPLPPFQKPPARSTFLNWLAREGCENWPWPAPVEPR